VTVVLEQLDAEVNTTQSSVAAGNVVPLLRALLPHCSNPRFTGLPEVLLIPSEVSVGTVSVVMPVTLPCAAEIVVVTGARVDAKPVLAPIVATAVFEELQVTAVVMF
jgi:hypothetical protein